MGKRKPKLKNKLSSIFPYFSSNQTRKNKTLKPSVQCTIFRVIFCLGISSSTYNASTKQPNMSHITARIFPIQKLKFSNLDIIQSWPWLGYNSKIYNFDLLHYHRWDQEMGSMLIFSTSLLREWVEICCTDVD